MSSTEQTLRPATAEDAETVAQVQLAARNAAVPSMPPLVHEAHEVVVWMRSRLEAGDELWVAENGEGEVVGYARMTAEWLDDLYVVPEAAGQGTGSALLELAKSVRPRGFALWVFETNDGARRFYRRHGLLEMEHTDGSSNEERSPDLRMVWPGVDPVAYFRRQIDEVDDELAVLLARRAALTAVVQSVKEVPGHAGRDAERENEIVRRMARHAPGLGEDALRRIMHEVITASLDAASHDPPVG